MKLLLHYLDRVFFFLYTAVKNSTLKLNVAPNNCQVMK